MIGELILGAVCGGVAGLIGGKYWIKRKDTLARKNAMSIIENQKKKGFTFIDDGHKIEILDVNNKEPVELPRKEWSEKEEEEYQKSLIKKIMSKSNEELQELIKSDEDQEQMKIAKEELHRRKEEKKRLDQEEKARIESTKQKPLEYTKEYLNSLQETEEGDEFDGEEVIKPKKKKSKKKKTKEVVEEDQEE